MKTTITKMMTICLAAFMLTSCVAKKRYVFARDKAAQEEKDNIALNGRIDRLRDTVHSLHSQLAALGSENESANNALDRTAHELNKKNSELNMTKEQIQAQRARMQQLQAFIDAQQKATADLKKRISDALVGFNSNELTVTMKNGKVYISMQESLLFPSGSAVVNPKGKEALSKVAEVLNTNADINIDIEGHTDSVAIHTKQYPDNWALSTARATSIAHVLIDDYKVTPVKLIASGRSSYMPIATNTTPEGRAQNRRTEIILEPKLDELMALMDAPKP